MTKSATNTTLNFCGSIATIRLSHDGKADGVSVVENEVPFGYATPLHIHLNQDEVFHVLSGNLCVEVDGVQMQARQGDLLRAPKGVPHRFIVTSEEGARVLVVTVGADFERFVAASSLPMTAGTTDLPRHPNPAEIALASAAAIENGVEMIGPPLTLAETRARVA